MDTGVFHYLMEPPALALLNVIHLFEIEEVQDSVKTLKSRTTADYLHTLNTTSTIASFVGICALAIYWQARHFLSQMKFLGGSLLRVDRRRNSMAT